MKKRVLSLALALTLILALVPAAFAAETVEIGMGDWVVATLTNVASTSDTPYKDWHESEEMEEYGYYGNAVITYFCDQAPVTLSTAYGCAYWWDTDEVTAPPTETDDMVGVNIKMTQAGTYLFLLGEGEYVFYVVIGGMPTAPITPAVTPAPAVTAPASTAKLKTTTGLNAVIPPSPEKVTTVNSHKVAKGENLNSIAKKYGVTVDAIKAENKAYFDKLAEINKKNKTNVALEANVNLNITTTSLKALAYTVQKGESLQSIAYNYYGTYNSVKIQEIKDANKAYFTKLAETNKKNKTNVSLEAGAMLTLPANGLMVPVTQGSLNKAAGIYIVKSGDTLADIAKLYYGSTNEWKKIYEANKDKVRLVGNSPMIYVGQWLVIPE